ncbi:hypothetical protein [Blastococcus deserti]|uniref:Uncharacterized protein n=1 Tax=Blastococcus deserti TaxID=2259033 RepID=A0ABW4XC82_9ACTN
MSPSEPHPPVETGGRKPPTTQEIPVVQPAGGTSTQQLPPHPDATTPAPVPAVDAPVPTGPVDFVPGLPGLGTPPPPAPPAPPVAPPPPGATPTGATPPAPPPGATSHPQAPGTPGRVWPETLESDAPAVGARKKRSAARPLDRGALLGLGLVVLSVVLLELGLTLGFGGESYWSVVTLWSGFATVCALLALTAFAAFFPAGDAHRSGPAWRVAAAGLVGLAVFWLLVVLPVVDSDRGFVLTAALAALGGALWIGPRRKD